MANIFYFTRPDYTEYSGLFPMSLSNPGGGMGSKTEAMRTAWKSVHKFTISGDLSGVFKEVVDKKEVDGEDTDQFIDGEEVDGEEVDGEEIEEPDISTKPPDYYDVCLIELLGMHHGSDENVDKFTERIEHLRQYDGIKLVYGSDGELMRWSGRQIAALNSVIHGWIANCKFQLNYWEDFRLPVMGIVQEPVSDELYRPGKEIDPVIVAGGTIGHQKNTEFFIELFTALKETAYKSAYVGSASLWGEVRWYNTKLENQLKSVTDYFFGSQSQSSVAKNISRAALGVFNPFYDTCNRFNMELMMSGVPFIAGPHLIYRERPCRYFDGSVKACMELLAEMTDNFASLPAEELRKEARTFAVKNFSYKASLNQLNAILEGLL